MLVARTVGCPHGDIAMCRGLSAIRIELVGVDGEHIGAVKLEPEERVGALRLEAEKAANVTRCSLVSRCGDILCDAADLQSAGGGAQ